MVIKSIYKLMAVYRNKQLKIQGCPSNSKDWILTQRVGSFRMSNTARCMMLADFALLFYGTWNFFFGKYHWLNGFENVCAKIQTGKLKESHRPQVHGLSGLRHQFSVCTDQRRQSRLLKRQRCLKHRKCCTRVLPSTSGVGNLRHAGQAWHAERFSMARWVNWNTIIKTS
jgi:hypothetical protein